MKQTEYLNCYDSGINDIRVINFPNYNQPMSVIPRKWKGGSVV